MSLGVLWPYTISNDAHSPITRGRIGEKAEMAADRSHIIEGRQFHRWSCHAVEPTIPDGRRVGRPRST